MDTSILMPFDILGQGLDLHAYFVEVFEPCFYPRPLAGDLQDQPAFLPGCDSGSGNVNDQIIVLDQVGDDRLINEMGRIIEYNSLLLHGEPLSDFR